MRDQLWGGDDDVAAFHALINRVDDHWLWIGRTEGKNIRRPTWPAARFRPQPRQFAFWMTRGVVPTGQDGYTMPTCGFLLCVQPDHMAVVDKAGRSAILARSSSSASRRQSLDAGYLADDSFLASAMSEYDKLAGVIADWPDTCVYCGTFATDQDHLLPRNWTGDRVRSIVPTVPACRDCNAAISDTVEPRVAERAKLIAEYLRKRWARTLSAPRWTKDDLAELSGNLRKEVEAKQRHAHRQRERVRVLEMGGLAEAVADGRVPLSFRDVGVAS